MRQEILREQSLHEASTSMRDADEGSLFSVISSSSLAESQKTPWMMLIFGGRDATIAVDHAQIDSQTTTGS